VNTTDSFDASLFILNVANAVALLFPRMGTAGSTILFFQLIPTTWIQIARQHPFVKEGLNLPVISPHILVKCLHQKRTEERAGRSFIH
jgi:hypothetical protein